MSVRRMLQGPRQVRERGGGSHEEAQDLHAARIRQELDLLERMNRCNFLHYD
jgi:hypothetical protein